MMSNIDVFFDTIDHIKRDRQLLKLTARTIKNTSIIGPGFKSHKTPYFANSNIMFEESLTLLSAYRLADSGKKTAVLNFANPVEPGGGVLRGANAQEEYLCRASKNGFAPLKKSASSSL